MSTRSIECQIARGQIARYLSGDAFSQEAISQLEAHVGGCSDCKLHLNERKNTLQSMLGKPQQEAKQQAPAPEVVTHVATPAAESRPVAAPLASLTALTSKWLPKMETPPQPAALKSMVYSVALALVLGAMSLASKNMDHILGTKVAATPEKPESASANAPAPKKSSEHSQAKIAALKPLSPLDDAESDAAKAARAARNAVLARDAKQRLARSAKHAAQSLRGEKHSIYQSEPAPRLSIPGQKPVASKERRAPSMLRKAPPGAPKVNVLAKRGFEDTANTNPKPKRTKMLQIETRAKRRSKPPSWHVVKKRHIKKPTKPSSSKSEIHVYAPETTP